MKNSYLNDIENFPEETKKEFLQVLKNNLTTFFNEMEIAIKNSDIDTIRKLIHKVSPTLIMLELESAQQFFSTLKESITDPNLIQSLLLQLNIEKKQIEEKGWI